MRQTPWVTACYSSGGRGYSGFRVTGMIEGFLAVDLHRSKPLISLVSFTMHFHCFQG